MHCGWVLATPRVTDKSMHTMQGGLRGHRKLLDADANKYTVTKVPCKVVYKKECFKHHGLKMFKECNIYKARLATMSSTVGRIQTCACARVLM